MQGPSYYNMITCFLTRQLVGFVCTHTINLQILRNKRPLIFLLAAQSVLVAIAFSPATSLNRATNKNVRWPPGQWNLKINNISTNIDILRYHECFKQQCYYARWPFHGSVGYILPGCDKYYILQRLEAPWILEKLRYLQNRSLFISKYIWIRYLDSLDFFLNAHVLLNHSINFLTLIYIENIAHTMHTGLIHVCHNTIFANRT